MFAPRKAKPYAGAAQAEVFCPLERAFDYVGHGFFENYTRWSPQVVELEKLTPGPVAPGATGRQVTLDRGMANESTFEIAAFSPARFVGLKGLSQPFSSVYEFEPRDDGATTLAFRFEVEEKSLFLRPFGPLIRASLQHGAQRTVENLKQLLEAQHAGDTSRERLAQFIYVASLDLQDPLRKIEAFSELLDNAVASSNKADIAYARRAMRDCAVSARKLVDDLLVYSSATLGEQKLETLDLREEIEAALASLAEAIEETKARVVLRLPDVRFVADRSQFACLVQNVLSNAVKYRKAGEPPRIEIEALRTGENALQLAILDYGVGFDEEFARTIFEPFPRLPSKAQYAGTGIELAICKSIADRHGWGISVKARPGEGAAFVFTLPLAAEGRATAGAPLAA
jgi:signal transduction histidine kinase